jgi:hypothetical protein
VSLRDVTPQQLDPLGTIVSRTFSTLTAAAAIVLGILQAVIVMSFGGPPSAEWAAALALSTAALAVVLGGQQRFAPFSRFAQLWVVILAGLGVILSYGSFWFRDPGEVTSLTPAAFGLLIFGLAPYVPARLLVGVSVIGAVLIGALADLQGFAADSSEPPIVFALIAASTVLGLGIAGAAISSRATAALRSWQAVAIEASREHAIEIRDSIARSVQQERVTVLNRQVLPFLTDLIEKDQITAATQRRARVVADRLRTAMVAEAERSWLDTLVAESLSGLIDELEVPELRVTDPGRRAVLMTPVQRTALRAYVEAIVLLDSFRPAEFRIEVERDGDADAVTIVAGLDPTSQSGRPRLYPYVAVMKSAFPDSAIEFAPNSVTMRFRYVA